ncbi:MAG: hypothetical protein K8I29_17730 [Alphaproteobacteria bacterium]|uniref:Uncharacterized protein n=1 Tax=Candidatus Nitrobium versatile TaxID=2884831 RepID=A0A953M322_9BACT|nr:hypothetical protein [Candidatus Nitrobium versatile]
MSDEDRRGDVSTLVLWKDLRRHPVKENWCCSAVKESGIEFLPIEETYPEFRVHRIRINFCPHCGQILSHGEERYYDFE